MNATLTLTKSSIKMFFRNRQALFFTLFSPLLIMVILGAIGFDKPPKFDVGIVSDKPTSQTQEFLNKIKDFPTFKIHEGNLSDELRGLNEGNRAVVLNVPNDFFSPAQASNSQPKKIQAFVNEGQQAQSSAVLSILNQFLDKTTLAVSHTPTLFAIEELAISVHNLRYIEFLLPGLMALSIMQMSVFSVAFVFARYKEKGVLKRLLATPMRPYQFVTANVITRLIVSVVQSAIFMGVGIFLFKANVIGSYWLILLNIILGALMFLGLGFAISGFCKTEESVPAVANLVVFPMLFLGGTFFPLSAMPDWLQHIARYLPLTYFSTALRDVMTKGSGIVAIKGDLIAMLIWSVVLITLATVTFSFQEKDSA